MKKRQMWASPHLGKRGHYIRFLLGSIGGILLLGLLLSVGGAMVLMPMGTNKALPSPLPGHRPSHGCAGPEPRAEKRHGTYSVL